HVAMMTSRPRLNEANALSLAGKFGFDIERLKADMKSPDIERILADNNALAEKLGIQGTPGFVIGDQIIPGAVDLQTLLELIAEARQS
ncbi:MAG: DsbA family protein, partial [Alphaproteobacteria bacterium]